jgi:hypothetical protein
MNTNQENKALKEIAEQAANQLEEEGDIEGAEEIREEIQNHLVDVVE